MMIGMTTNMFANQHRIASTVARKTAAVVVAVMTGVAGALSAEHVDWCYANCKIDKATTNSYAGTDTSAIPAIRPTIDVQLVHPSGNRSGGRRLFLVSVPLPLRVSIPATREDSFAI